MFSKYSLLLVATILVAIVTHRYGQSCGISSTYDSYNYMWASNTWVEKGILENRDGVAFLQQPPLFPLILSISAPHQALFASWLATFCLAVTVFFWSKIGKTYIDSYPFLVFFHLVLGLASPLLLIHQFLWSEPLFLMLLSVHFYVFSLYSRRQAKLYWVILIVLSNVFCLQRSIGIVFVLSSFVAFFYVPDGRFSLRLWKQNTLYLVLSSLFFCIWNGYVLSYKTPLSYVQTYGLQDNLIAGSMLLIESFSLWFVPLQTPTVGKLGIFLCIVWLLFFNNRKVQPLVVVYIKYALFFYSILLLIKKSDFSDTERFVAVLYPMTIFLLSANLSAYKLKKWIIFCIFLGSLYPIARTVKNIIFWKNVRCTQASQNIYNPSKFNKYNKQN